MDRPVRRPFRTRGSLYVDQLLAYRANDPTRKAAGLVLEVKGDFCRGPRHPPAARPRSDYVEVSLDSPYRYNPLHNDLDAYALAYGIAVERSSLSCVVALSSG